MNVKTAKQAQREYLQEWRKKNPDKVKEYNRTYWERRVQKDIEKLENEQKSKESESIT